MKDKYNMNDELSSSMTGGRFKRYAKVTSAMGGLAARLAGEKYLGIKINREQMTKLCLGAKPPYEKRVFRHMMKFWKRGILMGG